jgi:hypothetical protein
MASQPDVIVNHDHGSSLPARALFYMIGRFGKAASGGI